MDELLQEYAGKLLEPPLVRTARGWAEMRPGPCAGCSGTSFLIGWLACACRDDTLMGGHRTWHCQTCGRLETLGCRGHVGRGPLEEYGIRRA